MYPLCIEESYAKAVSDNFLQLIRIDLFKVQIHPNLPTFVPLLDEYIFLGLTDVPHQKSSIQICKNNQVN